MGAEVIFFAVMSSLFSVVQMLGANQNDPLAGLDEATRGQMVDSKDNQDNIPLIYGLQRVPVNICYMVTTGTNNNQLHLIGIIGEGEINGIHQVGGVDQIWLDDKLYTEYGSLVSYQVYTGTSTQNAHAALVTATAGMSPEDVWNDPLRNTAYIYMKLTYDQNKWQGLPNITVEVEGLKVYDTRTSTTGYSANPALCAYDFITRSSRRGGMGIDTARVVTASVDDAANFCDTKGWTLGLVLRDDSAAIDNLKQIIDTYRGDVIYSETQFKLLYRDWDSESVVMNLGESDIVEAGGVSSLKISQPSVFDTPNAVRVKFCNTDNKFIVDDYVVSDSTSITADGDFREETVQLLGITDYEHAMQMGNYHLERFRVNKAINFTGHSRCLALEPHDLVTMTHTFPGWSSKVFRVNAVTVTPAMEVAISAVEESSAFYNDVLDIASHNYHDTTLPDPTATVPNVINVTISEETYSWANRTHTRLLINFDPPAATSYPFWDHAEIWVSLDGGTNYNNIGTATGDFQVDPVEEGQTYTVKIVSVNIWGGKEIFASAYSAAHLITGKAEAPTAPDAISVVASGDTVTILTDDITDQDIEGYEVRLGDTWEGGIYIGTFKSAQIRLSGFKPGSFTFWLAPRDNRGRYSDTKRSGAVTVFRPAGYSVRESTWNWDYSVGVHSNTTNSTYASTAVLKCTHDADVLTGTWVSPIYDLSSSITVRVWGDFLTVFAGSSASWAALPSTNTWASIQSSSKRWYEVVNQSQAGILESTIRWGDSTDALNNSAKMFNVCSPEFTARYMQVDVTITDPDVLSQLYLKTLNMTAAYWST